MITDFDSAESTINYYTEYFDTYDGRQVAIMLQYSTTAYALWNNIDSLKRIMNYSNYRITRESMDRVNRLIYDFEKKGTILDNFFMYQPPFHHKDCINPLILLL